MVKGDTLVLFLILRECFQFFTIESNVYCRLIIWPLLCWGSSFYAHFWKSFNHKWVLNFVKGFFCICWDYHMVFIFQFFNMVYHIGWFVCTEESLHSWNKPSLILVYELLFFSPQELSFLFHHFLHLKYSLVTSLAWGSFSLTTTRLQPTTLQGFPSLSVLQRPAHSSPSFCRHQH